jgi:anti-sigma regulatory factor (Ser/Thr protein kinase)
VEDCDPDEVKLPSEPASVSAARRFVTRLVPVWLSADGRDRLLLAVSEAVSNAVRVSGDVVTLRMLRQRPVVRVEVDDDDPAPADLTPRSPDWDAEGGRGLLLVEAVTDDWGVISHPDDGKTVWLQVEESVAQAADPAAPGDDSAGSAADERTDLQGRPATSPGLSGSR